MAPTVFGTNMSPAVRAVLLSTAAAGVEYSFKEVNLMAGEHVTPEYLKMNPQHTVPVLKDGDFTVWDSHAITTYLVGKYGKDDKLYPKDLQKRAVIDQRLHFDSGILFPRLAAIVAPILREGVKTVPKEKADAVVAAYSFLETFLDGKEYVAGNELTLADFHTVATLTQVNVLVPVAANRFPRITEWLSRMQKLPYYSENQVGLDKFAGAMKAKLG